MVGISSVSKVSDSSRTAECGRRDSDIWLREGLKDLP